MIRELLSWYDVNKRELPFRKDKDPYRIWISEIMAQQTRIEAMLPYYDRFIEKYQKDFGLRWLLCQIISQC